MSILVDNESRVIVQGITGNEGTFHTELMIAYGTEVVAGVTPGRGGEWVLDGKVPVFDTVRNAIEIVEVNTSVIFVPAKHAADAIVEAAEAGIKLIVCITEGIPIKDIVNAISILKGYPTRLIGPNCPGILTPGEAKVGIIPGDICEPGNIGIVTKSGTLTYEVAYALKQANKGVSTCVGIGGDPVNGTNFTDILGMFEDDPRTEQVVLIGEIGGNDEEKAAEFIAEKMSKPVVAFIAGQNAPPGKRMGHAGAIIERGSGSATEKIRFLRNAGVLVASHPGEIPDLLD